VVVYGVTARAARVAVAASRAAGQPVSLLTPKTLWPVPERLIVDTAATYDRVVVVEMNMGQYVREIRRLLPGKQVDFLGQMNGDLIKPEQIREVI
jgi:2-oxoglutarate ferredoxin oxidoreductase subunit alpha